ncbi:MAG: hypothetical protein JJT85_06480 [Chromatiales bacterium]|nr:hypothetical protein [Chromatiales bacterium]
MAEADGAPRRLLGSGYQAVVWLEDSPGGGRRVVKEATGNWLTRPLRRAMLRREYSAYQRIGHLTGVPRCHGLNEDGALLLEFVPARPYEHRLLAAGDHDRFFGELLRLIEALHAAGVSHSDLKKRGNLLVDEAGHPWLIDFGAAVLRRPRPGPLNRLLFRHACRIDLNAWLKLKYRRRDVEMTAEDRLRLRHSWLEQWARGIRRAWRTLTLRQWRRRHR